LSDSELPINTIINADVIAGLKQLPDNSIDCIITSPPYWALRDYKVDGQLGTEKTIKEYIDKLVAVFDQCKRILKKTGTCWVVLGDTYSGNVKARNKVFGNPEFNKNSPSRALTLIPEKRTDLQNKTLLLIPHRFAIAMLDRGWILRNNIIWHKPNCMPSSAKDRFTVDFEHIFFFTKSKKYYFKTQYDHPKGRIKRSVWQINTRPFPEAHFAVFPESLVKQCLDAGCPSEICRKCGKSPTPIYNITKINTRSGTSPKLDCKCRQENGNPYGTSFIKADYIKYRQQIIRTQNRIEKCNCDAGFDSGIVLDPFMGSGTTALVALKNNRQFIGIELNPDYVQMAYKRIDPYLKQTKLY